MYVQLYYTCFYLFVKLYNIFLIFPATNIFFLLFFIILCSAFITIRIIITIFDILFIMIAFSVPIFSLSAILSKIICKLHISTKEKIVRK